MSLCIQLGNGALARGICCIAFGDGTVARGAYQVEISSKLTFPDNVTVEDVDVLVTALQDLALTYQALVDQEFAPKDFGIRSKAALEIAYDTCARHRAKLVEAAAAAAAQAAAQAATLTPVASTPVDDKGKGEQVEVVD